MSCLLAALLARPWARQVAALALVVLAITLFIINLRRLGDRAGRLAEQLETMERTQEAERRMLEAAARRPRTRGALLDRLRDERLSVKPFI